jgi:hypothetical protein
MESNLDSILAGEQPKVEAPPQAAVETPPPEQQGQTTDEGTGEQTTGAPPEPKKDDPLDKARKGLEAAAAAERKKRQDAEGQVATLREQLAALQRPQQQAQAQKPPPQDDDPKPLRTQFATEDEWLDERDAWRDRQNDKAQKQASQEKREKERYEKSEGIIAQAAALPGFELATFARMPVTDHMFDAILESEHASKLVHHLAITPGEAARIAALSPARQIAELTRIEDRLTATSGSAEEEDDDVDPKAKKQLPNTLTQTRNAKGQFEPAYAGPTPLNAILASK